MLVPLGHLRHDVVQDLELPPGEEQVQRLPDADHHHEHQREQDGRAAERLDHPQASQAAQLDQREYMNSLYRNLQENPRIKTGSRRLFKSIPVVGTCSPAGTCSA